MLTCRDATRLISEGLDHRLPLMQRASLRFHVLMCGACMTYKRQVEALHQLITQKFRGDAIVRSAKGTTNPLILSEDKRRTIKLALRSSAGESQA